MLISKDPFFSNYLSLFDSKDDNHFMSTDIIEKENYYTLKMEIPGISKENISIEYENENLCINITKKEDYNENDNYLKREICYGEYSRKFYVGNINEEEINANYSNGILTINIPKEAKIENKKRIEISE